MSIERLAIKQISEIQRKSVTGYWPGWKRTDYTNRRTLPSPLKPRILHYSLFVFSLPCDIYTSIGNLHCLMLRFLWFIIEGGKGHVLGLCRSNGNPRSNSECTSFHQVRLLLCRAVSKTLAVYTVMHSLCSRWVYRLLGKERPYSYM